MEPFSGARGESTEDTAGRKNSKIKSLKTRLFRRSKKTGEEANVKLSQSASDVTAEKGLGSDEDLLGPKGTMGSRAFSHDSIFLDDQVLTDGEPARVLSQENVPGKIKALQTKLQLQKMHFGPPPMVLPSRSPEEPRSHLEDFSFHSSNNASGEETLTKTSSYPASPPISPLSKSAPTKFQPPPPFSNFSGPTITSALAAELPLDFSSPPEFSVPLDTSAARHRLSIKPRNQRASTKKKSSFVSQSGSPLYILKPSDQYEFVKEQKEQLVTQEGEAEETKQEKADISQHLLVKPAELPPFTSEAAPKLSNQQEHETVASQISQVKPLRQVETAPAKQPHSSFIESEIKEETEKTETEKADVSQHLLVKSAELSLLTSETLPKLSSQQEHETVASQILGVKPLRQVDTALAKQPQSSFTESKIKGKAEETKEEKADVSQHLLLKSTDLSPVTSEAAAKLTSQQDHETVASQILGVKPLRRVDPAPAKQPQSSFIESKIKGKAEETKGERDIVSQHLLLKSAELSPVTSEAAPRLPSQQDHETVAPQILRVKPLRRVDPAPAKQPQSSFIESKIKGKAEETKGEKDIVFQHLLLKSAELSPVTSEAAPKLTSQQDHETVAPQILRVKPLRRVDTAPAKRPHSSFIESEIKGGAENEKADIFQHVLLKSIETKLSSQKEQETVASQILRVKPLRRVDTAPAKRPHSSFIESEIKEQREGDLEIQMSGKKTEVSPEQLPMLSSVASRSSFAQQQLHGNEENMRGIKKLPPGSGVFHSSSRTVKNQEEAKPQSGSFEELLKQTEAMSKTTGKTEEKENEELKKMQLKGTPLAAERLKQEGSPSRGPAVLWDRKPSFKKAESAKTIPQEPAAAISEETESTTKHLTIPRDRQANLKKAESATPVKNVPQASAVMEGEEVESSPELVDVAEEAKEEEGKKAFGIKLRSTSRSLKYRSETNSFRYSKDDQDDKKKRQEAGNITSQSPEKVPTNTGCVLRPNDPAPSGMTLPVKHNTLLIDNPPTMSSKVQTTPSNNKEAETPPQQPQPTPQTSSSEVSWMNLAMEKTKSLQQLFTSRFPRDLTGKPSAARPQAQAQPKNQTESQIQTIEDQQSTIQPAVDKIKEDLVQIPSQEQVVKPSTVAMQRKSILMESQMSKQPDEGQSQTNTTASQPAQSISWITQSPLRSHSQTTTTSQTPQGSPSQSFAQSYLSSGQQQQQPSWSNQGFQPATQVKPSAQTSEVAGTSVPASDSSLNKESPSLSSRPTIWTGSAVDRAAFLEKRAEWTSPPLLKGVELKKPQTEMQTSGDASISAKATAVSKDMTTEIRQAVKSAESSPIRVPERPRENRWPRKNAESPSSPSLLHTRPSVLQSDSNQPSWMELAKRKSMAWSDKTMD